jgi:hypothetical protein
MVLNEKGVKMKIPAHLRASDSERQLAAPTGRSLVFPLVALTLFCAPSTPSQQQASIPSAAEILMRSTTALGPMVKYRILTGTGESIVYQKTLNNGSVESRVETLTPVNQVMILHVRDLYQLYPDQRLAIDLRFVQPLAQIAILNPPAGNMGRMASLKGIIDQGGKRLYQIEELISAGMNAEIVKILPPGVSKDLPERLIFLIDTKTFWPAELDIVYAASTTKMQVVGIEKQVNLPDQMFAPPPNFVIQRPASTEEYVKIIAGIVAPKGGERQRPVPLTPTIRQRPVPHASCTDGCYQTLKAANMTCDATYNMAFSGALGQKVAADQACDDVKVSDFQKCNSTYNACVTPVKQQAVACVNRAYRTVLIYAMIAILLKNPVSLLPAADSFGNTLSVCADALHLGIQKCPSPTSSPCTQKAMDTWNQCEFAAQKAESAADSTAGTVNDACTMAAGLAFDGCVKACRNSARAAIP